MRCRSCRQREVRRTGDVECDIRGVGQCAADASDGKSVRADCGGATADIEGGRSRGRVRSETGGSASRESSKAKRDGSAEAVLRSFGHGVRGCTALNDRLRCRSGREGKVRTVIDATWEGERRDACAPVERAVRGNVLGGVPEGAVIRWIYRHRTVVAPAGEGSGL